MPSTRHAIYIYMGKIYIYSKDNIIKDGSTIASRPTHSSCSKIYKVYHCNIALPQNNIFLLKNCVCINEITKILMFTNALSLTLILPNSLNGINHLPFSEHSVVIFWDIKMRTWRWLANSIEHGCKY